MSKFPRLVMLESRRKGGVSQFPYESLNLGLNTDDDIDSVHKNRHLFFESINVQPDQVVGGLQVHEANVLKVESGMYCSGYDAFVTNAKDVFLTIGVADCTPILIYDSETQAIGAAHAGWRGTVGQIVVNVLDAMIQSYGTVPKNCYAFIGSCIDTGSFEVGEEVADQFDPRWVHYLPEQKLPRVDLKAANQFQLEGKGVLTENIEVSPFSTILNNDLYFSYRKEKGLTGRMLSVVGVRS